MQRAKRLDTLQGALTKRALITRACQDYLEGVRRRAPAGEADAVVEQVRRELGEILASAPVTDDIVQDMADRALIAATFGAALPDVIG